MQMFQHLRSILQKYLEHCTVGVLLPATTAFIQRLERVRKRHAHTRDCLQVTDMDDLLREHQHMLDTVTRECLLTDLTLASVVDEFLRDTHAFCARTAVTCADTMAPATVDDGHTVYARCVQQLNTMMTAMMKLPTSTSAGYRTRSSPPPTALARKPSQAPVHTFKAPTAAHASAHEQLISRCALCSVFASVCCCSIAKELIESLVAHANNRTV